MKTKVIITQNGFSLLVENPSPEHSNFSKRFLFMSQRSCMGDFMDIYGDLCMHMCIYLLGNKGAHCYNGNKGQEYICKRCRRSFKTKAGKKRHKCTFCEHCGYIFASHQKYRQHHCSTHTLHICKRCIKSFPSISAFEEHTCTFCKKCTKVFKSIWGFKNHKCIDEKDKGGSLAKNSTIGEQSTCTSTNQEVPSMVDLVGPFGTFIADDVILFALNLMKHHERSQLFHIDHAQPATVRTALADVTNIATQIDRVPTDKCSINIHLVNQHWLTSYYDPDSNIVKIYDSLWTSRSHRFPFLLRQLEMFYGISENDVEYICSVTQQRVDPSCGAFAIAFAYALLLGQDPVEMDYDVDKMREHLKDCIRNNELVAFPTNHIRAVEQNRLHKREKRKDADYAEVDRQNQKKGKKRRRSDPQYAEKENAAKKKSRGKRLSDPKFVPNEREKDRLRKIGKKDSTSANINDLITEFRSSVAKGCEYVCTCCDQLWFKHSVVGVNRVSQVCTDEIRNSCITGVLSVDNKEWICLTCANSVRKSQLPVMAKANGMVFPEKPPELQLNQLEERIVSPVNVFMTLQELPTGGQVSVKGNVVNVPADNINVVRQLPRCLSETGTIPVKLKRRLRYKSHYMYENVRPQKCIDATKYLLEQPMVQQYVTGGFDPSWGDELFSEEGTMWNEFLDRPMPSTEADGNQPTSAIEHIDCVTDQVEESEADHNKQNSETEHTDCVTDQIEDSDNGLPPPPSYENVMRFKKTTKQQGILVYNLPTQEVEEDTDHSSKQNTCSPSENIAVENDSDWSEDDNDDEEPQNRPVGSLDTMLFTSSLDENDGMHPVCIAPSEGNNPLSAFQEDLEELSFPTIFCGQRRPAKRIKPARFSHICKSEMRRRDRRAAKSVTNIFFKVKKLQMKQIQGMVWLSINRKKSKDKVLTAGDFKHDDMANQLVNLDEGFKIFRSLRGSPPYWEHAKKDIFAMIRQFGIPTWFVSFSCAETRWIELLRMLGKIVDEMDYTDEELKDMPWETKCRLIRSDPVTVSRYFDYRMRRFVHDFLCKSPYPLGKPVHWFVRTEYQQRGTPHLHGLIWVENAPQYGKDSNEDVEAFVDGFVKTDRNLDSSPFSTQDLVKLQTHRHSKSCKKNRGKSCRFNFPIPPMDRTRILEPFLVQTPQEEKKYKSDYNRISAKLKKMYSGSEISFETFLEELEMSLDDYILAIRSSVKDTTVFLKRDPNAIRVNGYNPSTLKAWQANSDIQFVTNAYKCAMYIVSYISKGQRGMSELLSRACEEARDKNSDIREQVRIIGNKFLRAVEICAPEAVYLLLELAFRLCSDGFVFINTSTREERPFMLKAIELILSQEDDSEDVRSENLISRYESRPHQAKSMCLADFAALYELQYSVPKQTFKHTDKAGELPENEYNENEDDHPYENDEMDSDNDAEEIIDGAIQGTICKDKVLSCGNGQNVRRRKNKKVIRYVHYNKEKDAENYYRESLMLFFPWTDEDKMIGKCESFEERYQQVREAVEAKRSDYEYQDVVSELEDAMQHMAENDQDDELWNDVAPNTEARDRRDRQIAEEEMEAITATEDASREYDIGRDLGTTAAGCDIEEEVVRSRISDDEYRNLAQSLNPKQKKIFYHVVKTVKTSDEQFFIFISGGAGVGKTRLTKCLNQALIRHYNTSAGDDPEQLSVLLTAPTGKAAYLIRGRTIHNGFGIDPNKGLAHRDLGHQKLNSMRYKYRHLKIAFIEEISMCGCKMLNFINTRMQYLTGSKKPFGGISVIGVGDLFQLKPVRDRWIFHQPDKDYSPLAPNVWKDNFKLFELTDIMRQRDDIPFAEALNRLREGFQTEDDIKLLKTRIIAADHPDYPLDATHVLYYNTSVAMHNNRMFQASTQDGVLCKATDIVIGDLSDEVKEHVKNTMPKKTSDTMGLQKEFRTAVGLKNELTVNIDVEDGLVNGAGCVAKHVVHNSLPIGASTIWVQFDEECIGQKLRRSSHSLYLPGINRNWTPIKPIAREIIFGRFGNSKVLRRQFPMTMSCAKTTHKSQGDTLEKAVIELPNIAFAHLHYVAFSRCTALENMYILGDFDASKIKVEREVGEEMLRLRTKAMVSLAFQPLDELNEAYFCILFHNCQSLRRHYDDIKADYNFQASDLALFVESKLCQVEVNEAFTMDNFTLYRNDFSINRSPYGSAIYYLSQYRCHCTSINYQNVEITVCKVENPQIQAVGVYCRPNTHIDVVCAAMNHLQAHIDCAVPLVVMGDFNIDCSVKNNKYDRLCEVMDHINCTQKINQFTTNGKTIIDLVFSNVPEYHLKHGTLESYYSYHKPIFIALKRDAL